jgi:hypothetical protein
VPGNCMELIGTRSGDWADLVTDDGSVDRLGKHAPSPRADG